MLGATLVEVVRGWVQVIDILAMIRLGRAKRTTGIVSFRCTALSVSNFYAARWLGGTTNAAPQTGVKPQLSATKARDLVLPIVSRIERSLKLHGLANVDELLQDLKRLHHLDAVIPLSMFVDAVDILCHRQDATRAELLIHLCRENLRANESEACILEEKTTQSRPRDDALNRLVSHAVSGLFRHGGVDDASKFWVRMSSSGYVTSRLAMEKMLDRLVGSGDCAPSLQLIDSLHVAMKAHRWHQNSMYYVRILKVLRQHIQRCCSSTDSIDAALLAVDALWLDAVQDVSASLPLEIHALRVHCFTSAMQLYRQRISALQGSTELTDGGAQYRERALKAFTELLDAAQPQPRQQAAREAPRFDDATLSNIANQVRSILSATIGNRQADSSSLPASVVDSDASHTAVGLGEQGDLTSGSHFSKLSAVGDTRRAIILLMGELAGHGQVSEVQVLLSHFLQKHGTSVVGPNPAKKPPLLSFLDRDGPTYFAELNRKMEGHGAEGVRESIASALSSKALLGAGGLKVLETSGPVQSEQQLRAAQQYTSLEKAWQAELVCEIMRNANVAQRLLDKIPPTDPKKPAGAVDFAVFKELEAVFYSLKEVLHSYQLKPGAKFTASFIDALSVNMQHVNLRAAAGSGVRISWTSSLAAARLLLDNLDEKTRRSPEVTHSIVKLLCEGSRDPQPDAAAVLKALAMVQELGNEKMKLLPATLSVLLNGARTALDDVVLGRLLSQLEEVLHAHCTHYGEDAESQAREHLLFARICAHCRLREGFHALQLLRVLRTQEGKAPLSLYGWLVNALHLSTPYSAASRAVARAPFYTVNYIVEAIKRDGHVLDANMVALLLRLFTKAAQVADSAAHRHDILTQMDEFVKHSCPKDDKAPANLKVNEAVLRELVKARCVSGLSHEALKLIQDAHAVHGVSPTGAMYEPVIYQCAVLAGELNKAEDILTTLVNKSIPLTDAIITSFVQGLMRYGELSEALDCIQDMYNQHRVRPTIGTWTSLLDASLGRDDVLEARRVVYLLRQLYTEHERQTLVGPAVHLSKGLVVGQAKHEADDAAANVAAHRQEALATYWAPKTLRRGKSKKERKRLQGLPSRQTRLGVPMGQRQRGVLSDKALQDRFAQYGLSLK